MKPIRFIPDDTKFDFVGKRIVAFALSFLLIVGSLGLTFSKGLNFGIDFTGGTLIEIAVAETPNLGETRVLLNGLELGAVSIQEFGDPRDLLIRLPQQDGSEESQNIAIAKVRGALDGKFGDGEVDYRRIEYVGPQVGKELKKAGLMAVLFSLMGILGYIWIRFEWQFGVAAIVALAHDVIATIGLFALTGIQFDLSTLAAVLMIAGYSINDTVVIFDRIRENMRKYKKKPLAELLNMSVNQTLSRTLLTGVTTLLALVALSVFGGEVISSFVNALIFGIIIGTYSSIYVASPILLRLNIRSESGENDKKDAVPAGA